MMTEIRQKSRTLWCQPSARPIAPSRFWGTRLEEREAVSLKETKKWELNEGEGDVRIQRRQKGRKRTKEKRWKEI